VPTGKTVLILGGGVGGIVAANRLRRALPSTHRVILVERESSHVFAPSLLWLMVGARTLPAISRSFEGLKRKGIEVVRGEVDVIDPEQRRVVVSGQALQGDYVIVALGAEFCPEAVPGLAEGGYTFCTPTGAEALRAALKEFKGGRLLILTAAPAYKCPAAPYEAAMLIEADLRKRGLRDCTQIDLFAAEPGPMGVAGPDVSRGVRAMVESMSIGYHPEHQVVAVDAAARRARFSNAVETDYDLLVYVPGHRSPRPVAEAGLAGESGGVSVDRHTLATRFEGVYAIGDVTSIPLKLGKPLPKAGVFAHAQAEVVARNIARAVTGHGQPKEFNGHGECFVETGGGKAGFGSGDFYAEPLPQIALRHPSRFWHAGKVLFEKTWLWRWF
jgi:sulfide:quinone oxidoreductase